MVIGLILKHLVRHQLTRAPIDQGFADDIESGECARTACEIGQRPQLPPFLLSVQEFRIGAGNGSRITIGIVVDVDQFYRDAQLPVGGG